MTVCVLCDHDLDIHKVERQSGPYSRSYIHKVVCWYEKGQIQDSSFCKCNGGFDEVEISISAFSKRSDD